jgi:hypothetical protein
MRDGDLPVIECKYEGWIGRQPWVLLFSIAGCGTDIILSLNIQQELIHSLIVVEKNFLYLFQSFGFFFDAAS